MTLLTATTTLLDAVKTYAPEEDQQIRRAVKRMEKRLMVLQVRAAKREKANRTDAFWDAMGKFEGGVCVFKHTACFPCKACKQHIYFGDFLKNAEWDGRGRVKSVLCPKCNLLMEADK